MELVKKIMYSEKAILKFSSTNDWMELDKNYAPLLTSLNLQKIHPISKKITYSDNNMIWEKRYWKSAVTMTEWKALQLRYYSRRFV
jgi:hypothetical protein